MIYGKLYITGILLSVLAAVISLMVPLKWGIRCLRFIGAIVILMTSLLLYQIWSL